MSQTSQPFTLRYNLTHISTFLKTKAKMPRQQDFNWAANNRRYASPEDKARHDAARGISTIPVPPNLEPHEIPDDPYGPGWDESARLAAYDKHNNYSSDHDYDGFNTWNRVPDPVGPMPPPLHIPKTEKEMEQYWPFKNDKVSIAFPSSFASSYPKHY